jgi:hypothetical protein
MELRQLEELGPDLSPVQAEIARARTVLPSWLAFSLKME